jgi:uncharacterized repeat protein (TIGR01451 family)
MALNPFRGRSSEEPGGAAFAGDVQPRAARCILLTAILCGPLLAALVQLGCGEGEQRAVVLETPAPAGAISGRVTDASNGQALPDAQISTSPATSVAVTDAEGRFVLSHLPPGLYDVVAAHDGFRAGADSAAITERDTVLLDFPLEPIAVPGQPALASGGVTGVVSAADGQAIPRGTIVELFSGTDACAGSPVQRALTDATGRYGAGGLEPAWYLACVRARIGTQEFAGRASFTVQPSATVQADIGVVRQESLPPLSTATGAALVARGDLFRYTFTIVSAGEGSSTNVVISDTLPILDNPAGPPAPNDRDGNQAFRYVTDRPTFDPAAIRYFVDLGDDEPGATTDVCFEAPVPGFPTAFVRPAGSTPVPGNAPVSTVPAFGSASCPMVTTFPTIAQARAAAEQTSRDGNQVVVVEYFDPELLARTPPSGPIEAEDAFEITVEAIHSVNEFRLDGGAIPERGQENGEWCNIITATSAENDFVVKRSCCRVVEALLEVRKTATDAVVPAGGQTEFLLQIGNNGSDALANVIVADTLDGRFLVPPTGDPGLVRIQNLCAGCDVTFNADSTIVRIVVPAVPPTDADRDGVFDDAEGFNVGTLVVRTPLAAGTFCNRVTVGDNAGRRDADLSCVTTTVDVEFDILNDDGLRTPAGEFQDVETFRVGDSVEFRTAITNRSPVPATNVAVSWQLAPEFRILRFERILTRDPVGITCSATAGTCSLTSESLAPGASIVLNYLTFALSSGDDVNRVTLRAAELVRAIVNEEPTTVNP